MSKEEKNRAVPRLRFPEFENEFWSYPKGNDLFTTISNKEHNSDLPILAITQEHGAIPRDQIGYHVSVTDKSIESYKVVEVGDFIISLRSFQGGIEYSEYRGLCSPAYIILRRKNETENVDNFFKYYFKTKSFIQDLNKNLEGIRDGKMVSYQQFSDLLLPAPSPKEQQKIADCLSSLDDLITAESNKLEALKAHKKGLMQVLFPAEGETVPKLRFVEFKDSGEWELAPIGNKVDAISGYPFTSTEISQDANGVPLMRGINITEGYIRHSVDMDRYFTGNIETFKKFILNTGDLIIGMDGSKVGKNSALVTEFDSGSLLIQRVARLRAQNQGVINFIFQQINSAKFHSYVNRINTSGGIPHISLKQIEAFEIFFPPTVEEQQKIASCLSSLDELITTQTQKIEVLKQHKKGMMQGLFPNTI